MLCYMLLALRNLKKKIEKSFGIFLITFDTFLNDTFFNAVSLLSAGINSALSWQLPNSH